MDLISLEELLVQISGDQRLFIPFYMEYCSPQQIRVCYLQGIYK